MSFDMASFNAEFFAINGIACPANVARSVHKRQAEFYFGRLVARHALRELGVVETEVRVGASREPVWPPGIVGSISHTRTLAAAAVVPAGECSGVGIDIEQVVGEDASVALKATVISSEELFYLQTQTGVLSLNALLTIAFSAKESLFKSAFSEVGRYFDFRAARVVHLDMERGMLSLELTEALSDTFFLRRVCHIGFCFIDPNAVLTYFVW
ncbi:4'-phosphopantetheinyl transferase family protein [Pinirhizobacter soli]|uniref:4'-phosphopantetheinyl transferase family protein n=1 Tax=Pinirhizobacter soli TaxID=2786953 RepID=UPI00202A05B0|nr:4'-phosphopantetheinyl transferase superfamily protein [Pinirhizobacter soli]